MVGSLQKAAILPFSAVRTFLPAVVYGGRPDGIKILPINHSPIRLESVQRGGWLQHAEGRRQTRAISEYASSKYVSPPRAIPSDPERGPKGRVEGESRESRGVERWLAACRRMSS